MTIDLQSHIGRLSAERERLEAFLGRHPAWSAWRGALARGLTGKTLQAHRDNVEQVLARDPVFAAWQALTAAIASLDEIQAGLPQTKAAEPSREPMPEARSAATQNPAANRPSRAAPMTSAAAPPPTLREVQRVALTLRGAPVSVETGSATIHAGPPEPWRSAVAPGGGEQGSGDDLTRIRGIDRRLADALTARGIRSFAEIASFTAADVRTLTAALGLGRRINAENWIEQAAVIVARDAAAKARADAIAADIARRLVVSAAAPGLDLSGAAALTPTTAPVPPEGAAAAMPHASIALVEAAARAAEPPDKPSPAAANDLPSIIRAAAARIAAPATQASSHAVAAAAPEATATQPQQLPLPSAIPIATAVNRAAAAIVAAIAANAATALATVSEEPHLPAEVALFEADLSPAEAAADAGNGGSQTPTPSRGEEPLRDDAAAAPSAVTVPPLPVDRPAADELVSSLRANDGPPADCVPDEPPAVIAATIAGAAAPALPASAVTDTVAYEHAEDTSGTRAAPDAIREGVSPAEAGVTTTATDTAAALDPAPAEAPALVSATKSEQTQSEAPSAAPDDLLAIRGLGPLAADVLAGLGVRRYAEIAAWSASDIARVRAALDSAPGPIRDGWIEQAAVLATGRLTAHAAHRLATGTEPPLAARPERDTERDPAFAIWLARHTSELPIPRAEPAPAARVEPDVPAPVSASSPSAPPEAAAADAHPASAPPTRDASPVDVPNAHVVPPETLDEPVDRSSTSAEAQPVAALSPPVPSPGQAAATVAADAMTSGDTAAAGVTTVPAPTQPANAPASVPMRAQVATFTAVEEATAPQPHASPIPAPPPDQPATAASAGSDAASVAAGNGHATPVPPPLPASAVADATARIAAVTRPPVFENTIHIGPQAAPAAGAASPLQAISERLQALERDLATLDIVPLAPPQPRRSQIAGPSPKSAPPASAGAGTGAGLAEHSTEAAEQVPASSAEPPAGPEVAPMADDVAVHFDEAAVTIVRRAAHEIGLDPLPAPTGSERGREPAAAVPDDYAAYRGRVEEAAVEIVRPGAGARPTSGASAGTAPASGDGADGTTPVRRFLKALTGA